MERTPSKKVIKSVGELKALSHPLRLDLLEAVTIHRQLTATQAAEIVGESPANCSWHLRQLAKYGFLEEVPGTTGRQRPWHVGVRARGRAAGAAPDQAHQHRDAGTQHRPHRPVVDHVTRAQHRHQPDQVEHHRQHHAGGHGFAVQPHAVTHFGFDGVAEGVAEVEPGAYALLGFVLADNLGFHGAASAHGFGQRCGLLLHQRIDMGFEPFKKSQVAKQAVFNHFGQAGR